MRKLILLILPLAGSLATQAGPYRYCGPYRSHQAASVSFHFGGFPVVGFPCYSPVYPSYPSYRYGSDGAYARPNFAVRGTLLGALAGGIIGHNAHHQGWEGAGIGAAAGLVLGGIAESGARARERAAYERTPGVSLTSAAAIANSPTVNDAPTVPAAPVVPSAPVLQPTSAMSGANTLFGR